MWSTLNQSTFQIPADLTKEEIRVEEWEQFWIEWHPFCYKTNAINHSRPCYRMKQILWGTEYILREFRNGKLWFISVPMYGWYVNSK